MLNRSARSLSTNWHSNNPKDSFYSFLFGTDPLVPLFHDPYSNHEWPTKVSSSDNVMQQTLQMGLSGICGIREKSDG